MGLNRYDFPMSSGVLTEDEKYYLGLTFREEYAAYVLFDIEANEIVRTLELMDASDWKDLKGLRSYPSGIAGKGAWFVSRYIMDAGQPAGMEILAYDRDTGELAAEIPVSDGDEDWPRANKVLYAEALGDGRYLAAWEDGKQSCVRISLYDGENLREVFVSEAEGPHYGQFRLDAESHDFSYEVYGSDWDGLQPPMMYGVSRFRFDQDFSSAELTDRELIDLAGEDEVPLGTVWIQRRKKTFQKGLAVYVMDLASEEIIVTEKETPETVFTYSSLPDTHTLLMRKSGAGPKDRLYMLRRGMGGFRVAVEMILEPAAEITFGPLGSAICIAQEGTTTVFTLS